MGTPELGASLESEMGTPKSIGPSAGETEK